MDLPETPAKVVPVSLIDTRRDQVFPILTDAQIAGRGLRPGRAARFEAGQTLFAVGERNAPAFLVLGGRIDVLRRRSGP